MATNKKPTKPKPDKVRAQTNAAKKIRVLKQRKHRTLQLTKNLPKQHRPIIGPLKILTQTMRLLRRNGPLFAFILVVYSLLSMIMVRGLGGTLDFVNVKDEFEASLGAEATKVDTSVALYNYVVSSSGVNVGESAGVYQVFIVLITSLAIIWACRQLLAGERVNFRQPFYQGMYPFVPFILVLLVIGLQLIPLLLGNFLFSTVIENGLAVSVLEKAIWALLYAAFFVLSLYMIISSIFALYIVTLPNMTPLVALRSARELVLHRRLAVLLRLIFLPVILFLMSVVFIFPLILFVPGMVETVFYLTSALSLVVFHAYLYNLYRALL